MGHVVYTADRQQDVAGIERAGGTGAAGGSADAPVVQKEQERFALDPLESEVDIAGKSLFRIAVQGGMGDL